jgi:hypothetical protein
MALNKAKILAADDVKLQEIAVPEWGGSVFLKVLSGTDREAFEESYADQKLKAFRLRFLVLALCDDKGDRLFSEGEITELGTKSAVVINRLFEAGWKLNAFREEDVEALGKD